MRTIIAIIIVWAILIGFFVTGVRVMAITPHAAVPVQAGVAQEQNADRLDPGTSQNSDAVVRSADELRSEFRRTQ